MPNKPRDIATPTEQSQRFIEAARELGCDEDEDAFDEKLKIIATQKPKSEKPEGDEGASLTNSHSNRLPLKHARMLSHPACL